MEFINPPVLTGNPGERSGATCCSPLPTLNSHLSYPSPVVIPTEVEGSAVRPAALSNLSLQAPRGNESPIKPHASTQFRNAWSQHAFAQ